MKITRFALAGVMAALLALPAAAQTMLTTPNQPTTSIPASNPTTRARPSTSAMDINSASAADLDKLPGIGKARANAIIKNRPYKGKDDLLSRHIIPSNVYNGIKDKIVARQG